MNIDHEVLNDLVDRNIVDVQLIPFNKKKQEVKRALELG